MRTAHRSVILTVCIFVAFLVSLPVSTHSDSKSGSENNGQIADIINYFDTSVENGSLSGDGLGKSARGRLKAMRNMVTGAGDLIEAGQIEKACRQLLDVYKKTDGITRPPDFVTGDGILQLASLILDLRDTLGCAGGCDTTPGTVEVSGFWDFYSLEDGAAVEEGPDHLTIDRRCSLMSWVFTCNDRIPVVNGTIHGTNVTGSVTLGDEGVFELTGTASPDTMTGTYTFPGGSGTWRAVRTEPTDCGAGLAHDLPFYYTTGTDFLHVETPGGTLFVSMGSWGAHFFPLTGHAYGKVGSDLVGYFARTRSDMVELSGDGDGFCEKGETCGFWGGLSGDTIRSHIPTYIANHDGHVTRVDYTPPVHPNPYFDNVPFWSMEIRFSYWFSLHLIHIGRIAPNLRDKILIATGINTDTYTGPSGDILAGARIDVTAGEELAQPQVLAIEIPGHPGYYTGPFSNSGVPWAQMEFTLEDTREDAGVCIFDLMDSLRKAEIQSVMDADMANPDSQRYGGSHWPEKWKWGAEGRLCLAYSPNPQDFSSIHTRLGGWFERPSAGTTPDELFSIVTIAKDAAAYDPTRYSSSSVDYLVIRQRADGASPFTWEMPDGTPVNTFMPVGEVLEETGTSLLIKWRDFGWAGGDTYQRAAYLLDGEGLKIKWGVFAATQATAEMPTLSPAEACNETDVICYNHEKLPGF